MLIPVEQIKMSQTGQHTSFHPQLT